MAARRLCPALAPLVLALGLWGCGQGAARSPRLSQLPVVRDASVLTQSTQCDSGANAYCAMDVVLVDRAARSSTQLLNREHSLLMAQHWSGADGDTGEQHAADSPGHKLRVTYATADGDLKGIDLGWIQRPRKITLALSQALFERLPALSIMLEIGQQ